MIRYENTEWYPIPNLEHFYASKCGKILKDNFRDIDGNIKILKQSKVGHGYLQVGINGKPFYVHRLIALTFIPNPQNLPDVNHKNEDKTNNSVENLEWCSTSYNINYGTRNQRVAKSKSKQVIQLTLDNEYIRTWNSMRGIQRELGYNHSYISKCCNGKYKSAYGSKWTYA